MEGTDVVVIGGGIMGLSTAYHLAKSGTKVLLVEMGKIAAGASGSNAGSVSRGDPEDPMASRIYAGSYELYRGWSESGELGYDIEFNRIPLLRCFTDEHIECMEHGLWKRRLENWKKDGLFLAKRHGWEIPEPNIADFITWGIEASATMINIFRVGLGLAMTAKRYGAKILTYTKVDGLSPSGGVWKVLTSGGEIRARFVVNAAGAWAPIIGKMVGIDIPISPTIGTALVTEPTPPLTNHLRIIYDPVWFDPEEPSIPESNDSSQRLGITTELDRHPKEDNYIIARSEHFISLPLGGAKTDTEPETLKCIAGGAIRLVPKLEDVHIMRTYAGMRPVCVVDGKSILGEVEGVDGFFLATGSWHTGMSYGPMCGKLVSQLIRGEETTLPIEEFSFSRFAKSHV